MNVAKQKIDSLNHITSYIYTSYIMV